MKFLELKNARFHFVGIGGIGMCGLAEVLHNMGASVRGSDISKNEQTEYLKTLGIQVEIGHNETHLHQPDVVVYSSAINKNNPEIQKARALKIPLIPRAEALAEIMRLKRGIAISGTHGKTTTTSLISSVFLAHQLDPTIVIGGRLDLIKSTAVLGTGEWLITEADESDGSFHKLSPEIAVITNIGADHLDYFKSFENIQKFFYEFALKIPFYGFAVVYGDDPLIKKLFENFPKRIFYYGFKKENDFRIEGELGAYKIFSDENLLGEVKLNLPGKHNALNALAAAVVSFKLGVSIESIQEGFRQFKGVDRRFHFKGETRGIKVYDDYGHHPTEVKVTLEAFKEKFPNHRLVVYFQPHRYSRTEHLWHEFVNSFALADVVFLASIYPASEEPIPGITSERLAKEMKHAHCFYYSEKSQYVPKIIEELKPNDIFLTLGAGDGYKLGLDVLKGL
ncbi:MAG TPA: UDP-N-acetylmuramate--L-alanine ligase [Pseudobdellovibrionaceae bacterium]|nr:UDP-N-acetylmuramate--L-alanine ligase [Pseudobdellovibrionaceae bacterium]